MFRDAELPEEARRDLESGDYLFGRGACDMKGGDAVFLVLAKHLAEQAEKLHGNLLLSFNPVEETLHRGIIEELPLLRKLQEQHNLTFRLAINNDFICPMYVGDTTRYVYTGAVGKLLPMFYIIGRETHVAQCFEGFSPDLTAAELTRIIDRNPDFCEAIAENILCRLPCSKCRISSRTIMYRRRTQLLFILTTLFTIVS